MTDEAVTRATAAAVELVTLRRAALLNEQYGEGSLAVLRDLTAGTDAVERLCMLVDVLVQLVEQALSRCDARECDQLSADDFLQQFALRSELDTGDDDG